MLKKTELDVSIHCEGPFSPSVYRRLFRLNRCYQNDVAQSHILISIDDLDTQEEKSELQEVTYYVTRYITLTLEITTEEALYATLVFIINEARMHLDEIGYDPLGDSLIISTTPTEDNPNLYNFKWSFTISL